MNGVRILFVAVLILSLVGSPSIAAEREQLLTEPGVYVTFAVFQADHDWWMLESGPKQAALAEAGTVLTKYGETLAVDTYLLRGLSDRADLMIRVHGRELRDIQNLMDDLLATPFGKHLDSVIILNGLTKKVNYVPGFRRL
jgi:chlorite dismutase